MVFKLWQKLKFCPLNQGYDISFLDTFEPVSWKFTSILLNVTNAQSLHPTEDPTLFLEILIHSQIGLICWLVAVFHHIQLHSNGKVVLFPNLDLLLGTQCHGQLRVSWVPSLPWHQYRNFWRMSENVLNLLAIIGPTSDKVCGESNPDPQSSLLPLCKCGGPKLAKNHFYGTTYNHQWKSAYDITTP